MSGDPEGTTKLTLPALSAGDLGKPITIVKTTGGELIIQG